MGKLDIKDITYNLFNLKYIKNYFAVAQEIVTLWGKMFYITSLHCKSVYLEPSRIATMASLFCEIVNGK